LIIEYAKFEALYLNNLDKAISILEEVKVYAGLKPAIVSNIKLDLGDYYLIKNDIWEATLLYSQVDKAYKEGLLGERARYRNALLSYYRGDFEWAQQQFDILKSATSKLISNDAIDMSVFITDNLGLDTTAVPLQLYAESELLLYQNKFEETFAKLDQIIKEFPEHGLKDDILYLKARIYSKRKRYSDAILYYTQIIENHKEEIRCDNAIWELAELYQFNLKQLDKAQVLYEQLFLEFSNSTFAVEARKRYRELRGDTL
jgi:TolA-binding protein